jgi:isocitrate dehydrogenase
MTKDLALLYEGEAKPVNSRAFLNAIAERLAQ